MADQRRRLDYKETIIICVGPELEEFTVHKSVATKSSEFIRAALSNDWKEAKEKRVTIEDTEVQTFENYLHWLYTSELITSTKPNDHSYLPIVKLYILGDYLNDSLFCNAALERVVKNRYETHGVPSPHSVKMAYERTPEGSPLRKIFREFFASSTLAKFLPIFKDYPVFPREFVVDVCSETLKGHPETANKPISNKSQAEAEEACREHMSAVQPQQDDDESN